MRARLKGCWIGVMGVKGYMRSSTPVLVRRTGRGDVLGLFKGLKIPRCIDGPRSQQPGRNIGGGKMFCTLGKALSTSI